VVAEEDGEDSLIEAEEEISEAAVVDKDAVVGTTTTIEAVSTTITIEATTEEGVEVAAMVMATPSRIPEVVTITTEEEAGEDMIVMPTLLKEDQLQQKRSFIQIL
jgi:glucosamine 6-phosphate synthetase-like amidotransferase/phosphosugar isomerase protein|tara:strand:+ start:1084 stop:1398 length:315 start_codon:yes stop_codon:yes gene_type:complete